MRIFEKSLDGVMVRTYDADDVLIGHVWFSEDEIKKMHSMIA